MVMRPDDFDSLCERRLWPRSEPSVINDPSDWFQISYLPLTPADFSKELCLLLAVSGPEISTWHPIPPRGCGTVLPRQDVAILVEESSGGLDLEFVDALQEPANRLVWIDLAVATGHFGAH